MNAVAVILAAGRGRRAGGPKALHPFAGRPWWQVQQARLDQLRIESIWVVSEAVKQAMAPAPVTTCVVDPDAPMFVSVLKGVEAAGPRRDVFILPVDVPASTDNNLWRSLALSGQPAAPRFGEQSGHPIFLPATWRRTHLAHVGPNDRLDDLIRPSRIEIPVSDPLVACNLNTPEDWKRLEELQSAS
ncbi:MAG: NTP transferase domain-containing protein [Phycisphaerales bacterium]